MTTTPNLASIKPSLDKLQTLEKAKAEMYQDLLGMQQDQVRAGIAGLEREVLNLLSADDNPGISSNSHTPASLFSQAELAAV